MAFTIITKQGEKTFADKELVNISSNNNADYQVDFGFQFMLTVQYDSRSNKCVLLNQFHNQKFLFKGKPIPAQLEIEKICKIMVDGSDEFITIKVIGERSNIAISDENMTEADLKAIYGDDINATAKIMVEKRKSEIEKVRVGIVKEIGSTISDLKRRMSQYSKCGIVLHVVMFFASLVCAFGVSNYLSGLPLDDAGSVIQMPTNMKLIFLYAAIIYGIGLILKQGIFYSLQNKLGNGDVTTKSAEKFMIVLASIFYGAIYIINLLYYIAPKTFPIFAVLISLFFVGTTATLALACGYCKNSSIEINNELGETEYRQDFEQVIKLYQQWIERYVNTFSQSKIRNLKDKQFMLQIKSFGEIVLGFVTAPFLAYGVSNTLAMCFPEAAGWVRMSGLRLSPVFLALATFLIIFAFFAFANGFLNGRKIAASNVLKQDGFSNFMHHGVEIYGIEGVNKLNKEMRRSFAIGCAIIFIEFSMNASYFMGEIGGDLGGMILSCLAALVPTALLIAETYMLSSSQFKTFVCDEILAKVEE